MRFNEKVNNPLIGGAIEVYKKEPGAKTRKMLIEQILQANFLCPAAVSMEPLMSDNGDLYLPEGCEVSPKMIQNAKGCPLLMAFTSQAQMDKWMENRAVRDRVYGFACDFSDYVALMLQKQEDGSYGPAEGFVIDPYGYDLVVDRDMVANLWLSVSLGRD